ncbi:hypothetical protein BME99_27960 [Pseudomonas protegens]|nr:hypothetical protein BME99_27960 [Pseudomonas protegens]
MFEAHQVHCRALQLQFQGLAVEHGVQTADSMFVGAEAAMFMLVIMGLRGLGGGQWQQGERQGE